MPYIGQQPTSVAWMTKELADSLFYYKDGNLYWKDDRGTYPCKDKIVGSKTKAGYLESKICKKPFKTHRVIFLMHHGYLPEVIDHIDGNRSNNNIENLRAATHGLNKCNQVVYKSNTSGVKGVFWDSNNKNWKAQINFGGKRRYLGRFKVLSDAEEFVNLARDMLHGEFARVA